VHEGNRRVTSDAERLRIFQSAAKEFPMLARMHTDVVIERAFHRKAPRDLFFEAARSAFDDVKFVWVESDEETALERFRAMYEAGGISSIEKNRAQRASEQAEFEPFDTPPLTFKNELPAAEAVARLLSLIGR
jgi:hypothetical protein